MPQEAYLLVTESRFAAMNEILGRTFYHPLAVFWPQYPGQPFFWKSVVRLAMVSPAGNGFSHGVSLTRSAEVCLGLLARICC
jgi:hypothetical protein